MTRPIFIVIFQQRYDIGDTPVRMSHSPNTVLKGQSATQAQTYRECLFVKNTQYGLLIMQFVYLTCTVCLFCYGNPTTSLMLLENFASFLHVHVHNIVNIHVHCMIQYPFTICFYYHSNFNVLSLLFIYLFHFPSFLYK